MRKDEGSLPPSDYVTNDRHSRLVNLLSLHLLALCRGMHRERLDSRNQIARNTHLYKKQRIYQDQALC